MERVNNDYLGKHKKFRLDSKKLAAAFFLLAFLVAIVVFWWLKLVGITVTGEAFCGLTEHTHGDDCYVSEVICDFDDSVISTLPSGQTAESTTDAEETTDTSENEQESASEATQSETDKATTKAEAGISECKLCQGDIPNTS